MCVCVCVCKSYPCLLSLLSLLFTHTAIILFSISSSSSALVLSTLEEEARRFRRSNVNFNDDRNCFPDVLKEVGDFYFLADTVYLSSTDDRELAPMSPSTYRADLAAICLPLHR